MKNLIYYISILFISLSLSFCTSSKNTVNDKSSNYGSSMINLFEDNFTEEQFDSICNADTIPSDLLKWHKNYIRDYETREGKTQYLFIKKLGNDEQIYRLEKVGNTYNITKRIIK